jgi:hypothetical protein
MNTLNTQRFGAVLMRLLVTVGVVLLLGALTPLPALARDAGTANHASAQSPLPKSPLSGGVLVAQAIHSGKLQPTSHGTGITPLPQLPTCSPTPCALPNVQASEGGKPVNEDPIAANPSNAQELLTGGNDYNCSSLLGFFASSNGGSTWNHTCMNTPTAFPVGCGDPGVGYDLSGAAYITGIASTNSSCFPGVIIFEKSTDNGAKWSAPAVAVSPLFSGGLTDKPWLQVDDNPGSPHAGALYLSVTQFDASGNNSEISVSHSSNGGSSWTTTAVDKVQVFPRSIDQFSDLAIGKDGTVFVSWMRCTANGAVGDCGGTQATLVLSQSTDGGSTWSKPLTIATVTLAPDPARCCFYGQLPNTSERVSEGPVIGIDNSSGAHAGNLYAAFYTWTGSFLVVEVATSTNGGSTWGAQVRVTPPGDPNDEFFPWLSVSNGGLVGVTWLDRRDDPANLSYEAFAAISNDGGATFPNLQIASAASNPKRDGFKGSFMGDYTGNVWDSTGTILYASWMDSRNGVNMQDEVGGRIGTGSVPTWNIIASPNTGTQSQLNGVAAVSASNVWAVGFSTPSSGVRQTLIEQWNGSSWNVVTSPNVGTSSNQLSAVAVVSASDIWAVGSSTPSGGVFHTLIEQWNGTNWSVVASPNVGTLGSSLNAVAVVAANDIWAVGSTSGAGQTLIEHWNGTSWSVVTSPNVGTMTNVLTAVAVVSASDIWAVGYSTSCSTGCIQLTLIEQWDGTKWNVVTSPNVDTSVNALNSLGSVAVVSATDIWAVGASGGINNAKQTLIEQWNGTKWSLVSSPNVGTSGSSLDAVAVVAANDIWAVGFSTLSNFETLTEHWNGTSWQVVKSLNIGTQGNTLAGVAAITATNVWAVGIQFTSSTEASMVPLIEQYCC